MRIFALLTFAFSLTLTYLVPMTAQQSSSQGATPATRPPGPCDIYATAGAPCVAAHSTTRALYGTYDGPLYQVMRRSDKKTLDIGVVRSSSSISSFAGGYADASSQDKFCADTICWITKIYDQSPKRNDLIQAPRGGFNGPALGGFNNLPIADMAPVTIMGHKVYGVFIEPGMGLRLNDVKGTAVDDQAEGQYWVINGKHYNSGCCFDYGNAEIDSRDDDNGTMETLYFGNATPWYSGAGDGPWIMTDQENNLVGCVNDDGTKGCPNLSSIPWRFVTAIGKGEPHHWTSMGGDAQKGSLRVMFDGHRVNPTYDPMRKQGAILLGNGGDNSDGSQGTFYEGAMTAAGTFPSNDTDQLVQANIVAAKYDVAPLSVTPANAVDIPPGPQTFTPGSSRDFTVKYTNTTGAPVAGVSLSLTMPTSQWSSVVSGTTETSKVFTEKILPGTTVSASFRVTAGRQSSNSEIVAKATWVQTDTRASRDEVAVLKIRNAPPVKINEFRVTSGAPTNTTDSFIELFNAGSDTVDLSNWTLTERPARQAISSVIRIPSGTKLAAGKFYLLGLSNSGLAVSAKNGDSTLHVRSIEGMSIGDIIHVGSGRNLETRKIAKLGTAASSHTTLWQSLPEDPVITIPVGSSNIPVESTAGFAVGQKIALGYGAVYPSALDTVEQYEVATVTKVGKPGTQAYLAMEAPAGARNIKVTELSNISVGDKIRLDIDSVGHGIEFVEVSRVGTAAKQTNLVAPASVGATSIRVRNANGFIPGAKIAVGTPASIELVTVKALGGQGGDGVTIDFTPAMTKPHVTSEWVVSPGTGLDLAGPLKFKHSANLPFSNRGTGISFEPATRFPHSSNEPVQALGTGITLDKPLNHDHPIHDVVSDAAVKSAGYQGTPAPDQWFGGPELTTRSPQFDHFLTVEEGSMVLRGSSGEVADSLNYGNLVDPWLAEGYQGTSGARLSGCYAPAPGSGFESWSTIVPESPINTSAGRFPDGTDSDSNCIDFSTQTATSLAATSRVGATNVKVASTENFHSGQKVVIDSEANAETVVISEVGTAGATTLRAPAGVGQTILFVPSVIGFKKGQTITIQDGKITETAIVAATRVRGGISITLSVPLARPHRAGVEIVGSGITFSAPLVRSHANGAQVSDYIPTPGAPNQYSTGGR